MLVAPWLGRPSRGSPPTSGRRRAPSLPSSSMGLAALSYFGCFSALRLHVSHFEGPSQDLAPAVNAVYVCQCRMKVTAVNIEKGSVESTHKVPTSHSHYSTTRNTGQTGAVTIAKGSVESCFHGGSVLSRLRVVRTLINTTDATTVGVFYERSGARVFHNRCKLFAPPVSRFTVNKKAQRAIPGTPPARACLQLATAAPLTKCYLPRRTPINGFRNRGERRLCPTTSSGWARREPVALTLTALAPKAILRFGCSSSPVSRFTVNKKAQSSPVSRFPVLTR